MNFRSRLFSKRFPALDCDVFLMYDAPLEPLASSPYRGTAAAIILPDGRFWVGVALCSPADTYVKAVGRAKALGRAYRAYLAAQRDVPDHAPQPHEHGRITFETAAGRWQSDVGPLKTACQVMLREAKLAQERRRHE